MAFEEKRAWIMVVVSAAAYATYAAIVLGRAGPVPLADVNYGATMLWCIGLAIAVSIVATIAVGIASGRARSARNPRDGRCGRFGDYSSDVVLVIAGVGPWRWRWPSWNLLLDRQRDLSGVRPSRRSWLHGEDRRLPTRVPDLVKPTRSRTHPRVAVRPRGDDPAELADRHRRPRQDVIAIEQGRTRRRWRWPSRFARVFGVPLDNVFHYPDSEGRRREGDPWPRSPTEPAQIRAAGH